MKLKVIVHEAEKWDCWADLPTLPDCTNPAVYSLLYL